MHTYRKFECDICNLFFNSRKDKLKHKLGDYHSSRVREEYEDDFYSVAKTISKAEHKVEAKADSEDNAGITYPRKNNCAYCGKNN